MSPCGIWHGVIWYKLIDYLGENAASSFKVEGQDELSTVKMEAARLSKTSINFPHNSRRVFSRWHYSFNGKSLRNVIKKRNYDTWS